MSTSPACILLPGDEFFLVDGAHNKAGEIVFPIGIEAGHLGGFAADQRAAVRAAGLGHTAHHVLSDFTLEFADGQIIEEKQRRCALHGDVVDAMIDQVGADRVMHAEGKGYLELGADTIRA